MSPPVIGGEGHAAVAGTADTPYVAPVVPDPYRLQAQQASTFPRNSPQSNLAIITASQTIHVDAISLPSGMLVSSISYHAGNTALVGGVHQIFALVDAWTRAVLATTADDGATAWAAGAAKTLAIATPFRITRTDVYHLAVLVEAGTVPTLMGNTNNQTGGGIWAGAPPISGTANAGVSAFPATLSALGVQAQYAYASVA